jgi:uncharacterized protein (TIGR03118 family)
MNTVIKNCKLHRALGLLLFLVPSVASAQQYTRTDLVSSIPGVGTNALNGHDAQLVNPWGLTRSAAGPFWISDNGSGFATVYNGIGNKALTVSIPAPPGVNERGAPTGVVANGTADFPLPGSTAAKFIFVTEQGVIAAWNGGATAVIVKNNSTKGAIYKGCTIAESNGQHYLYVANFHSGEIEVYDSAFTRVSLTDHAFHNDDEDSIDLDHDHDGKGVEFHEDRRNFAPFNIQAIGTNLFVAYAKQDAEKKDEVDGTGLGFVDVFNTPDGVLLTCSMVPGSMRPGEWHWPLASSANLATRSLLACSAAGRLRHSIRSTAAFLDS